jgi:4-carboxymuconolactone decarboxylase
VSSRLPELDPAQLDPERKRIYDEIASHHRGTVRGPWLVELRVPEAAAAYHALFRRLCVRPNIGRRLFELMVLVVARHWSSQFEWHTHERQALEQGVSPQVVEAIRERREPPFQRDDERLVYELIDEINRTHTLSTASYERGLAAFGEENLVELVLGAGTYTSIAMQLNVFGVQPPAGGRPLD